MDYFDLKIYCLSKKGAFESYPFGAGVPVIKVIDKMFVLFSEENEPGSMNLKCDPEDAQALRKQFKAITPGYHMNKQHWNTVLLDGSVPENVLKEMIDQSYTLVVKKLKRSDRDKLYLK